MKIFKLNSDDFADLRALDLITEITIVTLSVICLPLAAKLSEELIASFELTEALIRITSFS